MDVEIGGHGGAWPWLGTLLSVFVLGFGLPRLGKAPRMDLVAKA
jgi:hypothetical protein